MRYEYKTYVNYDFIHAEAYLNELGSQGWEVVAYQTHEWGMGTIRHYFLLKRAMVVVSSS